MKTQIKKYTLKNGLRVVLAPDSTKHVVTALVLFRVGSRCESADNAGISHVLEHMFYKGSKKRPSSFEVASFIEGIGGEHNAFTNKERTGYYTKVAFKYLEQSLDFLSDLILDPLLKEADLEREKKVIIQEYDMYEDQPDDVADNKFEIALFGDNPLGRPIIGRKDSINAITREKIADYRRQYYGAGNAVLVLAGNLSDKSDHDLLELLERYFKLPAGPLRPFAQIKLPQGRQIESVHRKTEQSQLVIGFRGAGYDSADRYKLNLLALILGGSMSSRMFCEIREKRGLAYAVHTSAGHYTDTGTIETSAGVPHDRVYEAAEAIALQYKKAVDITAAELAKAKEIMSGRILMAFEDSIDLAEDLALGELFWGGPIAPESFIQFYQEMTLAEIIEVARKYIRPETMALSYVGPVGDITKFKKILTL